jgi:hypothetical protein
MKKQLIKYSLFQKRRKFNPIILFRNNPALSYEEFVSFLERKTVESPGEEYYNRVKKTFESYLEKDTTEAKVVEEVKENKVLETQEVSQEIKVEEVKENKNVVNHKKTRRKRRKENEKPSSDEASSNE